MTSNQLQTELSKLLRAEPAAVRAWESGEWERLAPDFKTRPVVLFGAGGIGRKTLRGLRLLGVEPVAFADNNASLHGRDVEGIPVFSLIDAVARWGSDATFIVTIWGGHSPDRMADRIRTVGALGAKMVASFYPLFTRYAEHFLPHYACDLPHRVYENRDAVIEVGNLWTDEASRDEYLAQIEWRAKMQFAFPEPVSHEIYFPNDLLALSARETFVDCGAFDGDTLRSFLGAVDGEFEAAIGFEPDPQNFASLQAWAGDQTDAVRAKIEVAPYAIADVAGTLRFAADGTEASSVREGGEIEVQATTLDRYFGERRVTYLKMDIEGAELSALRGAARLIARERPVLAVCIYHQQSHIWEIPAQINAMVEDYDFFLRPHLLEGWDTVCYAIPRERRVGKPDAEPQ